MLERDAVYAGLLSLAVLSGGRKTDGIAETAIADALQENGRRGGKGKPPRLINYRREDGKDVREKQMKETSRDSHPLH